MNVIQITCGICYTSNVSRGLVRGRLVTGCKQRLLTIDRISSSEPEKSASALL